MTTESFLEVQDGNLNAGTVKAWHRHNDTAQILSFIHGTESMTPFTRSHFITNLQPIQSSHAFVESHDTTEADAGQATLAMKTALCAKT